MSAGQAKTVKKVCKGNNDNCIAIAERIFEKLQTKKIESKLSLLEISQKQLEKLEENLEEMRDKVRHVTDLRDSFLVDLERMDNA